jgi:hypothetical protein
MHRRDFLRFTGIASAGIMYPAMAPPAFAQSAPVAAPGGWRVYEVTTRVEILKPSGVTRVWVPTPLKQDTAYQKTLGNAFQAEGGSAQLSTESKYGAEMVMAEWPAGVRPVLTHTARFATRDVAVDLSRPGNSPAEDRATLAKYTGATELMPIDGSVKELSSSIVKGKRGDLE